MYRLHEKENYNDLIRDYANDYFSENRDLQKYTYYFMDELDDLFDDSPSEILLKAYKGGRYGFKNDKFNPNDLYFITTDHYNDIVSIQDDTLLVDYLSSKIDKIDFLDWLATIGFSEDELRYL